MTMQENGNLVEIFRGLGMEDCMGDFILGLEGRISPQEAVEKIKEKKEIRDRNKS